MKKLALFLPFLALIACNKLPTVSCDKPTNDINLMQQLMIGKWEWHHTDYDGRGGSAVYTPAQSGFTNQLVFDANGKAYFYKNNTLENKGTWRFSTEKEFTGSSGLNVIVLEKDDKKPFKIITFHICNDSLYFPRMNYDLYETWSKQ
jgi:hypothetical protein